MIIICTLYQFINLKNFPIFKTPLLSFIASRDIKGTILLAKEGINGTIAGQNEAILQSLNYLQTTFELTELNYKFSTSQVQPFKRLKIKLKREIVTMGVANINPKKAVGTYVLPKDWNTLISDPQTLLIDTRNDYEYGIGTFKNAINPNTKSFREFPQYVEKNLCGLQHKKVAMFCTGGIRCEKSTSYLKQQGFKKVYHLKGGILKYLAEVPKAQSLWQGECFVFDKRVAVTHGLTQGKYHQCYACRYPITTQDKNHPHYSRGISCPNCYGSKTTKQLSRYKERQKQSILAQHRDGSYIDD